MDFPVFFHFYCSVLHGIQKIIVLRHVFYMIVCPTYIFIFIYSNFQILCLKHLRSICKQHIKHTNFGITFHFIIIVFYVFLSSLWFHFTRSEKREIKFEILNFKQFGFLGFLSVRAWL